MIIDACPLESGWQDRLRRIAVREFAGTAKEAILLEARTVKLGRTITVLRPEWEIAGDDVTKQPVAPDSHYVRGPFHLHTEFDVSGRQVHVDRIWGQMWGPGRGKIEVHIYIDGTWRGFGGLFGASLGVSDRVTPAVARLADGTALVVRFGWDGWRQDSQSARANPDHIEVVAMVGEQQQ